MPQHPETANLSQTIAWLREHQNVLVLTHARPDGMVGLAVAAPLDGTPGWFRDHSVDGLARSHDAGVPPPPE